LDLAATVSEIQDSRQRRRNDQQQNYALQSSIPPTRGCYLSAKNRIFIVKLTHSKVEQVSRRGFFDADPGSWKVSDPG
jgi:hypothetical protein